MKKMSSVVVKMAVVFVAVFSLIIAANAGYISRSQKTTKSMSAPLEFYANVTFNVFEGDGCGCVPLRGIPMNATGRDTDHSTSGITDENGTCILQLEYDRTYRISIQEADHESVLFDFVVIDDQMFTFHMKEVGASTPYFSFIQMMLQKLLLAKHIIS
ncbi:MAG: hypothetical protein NTX92_00195 [Euryarchaeota archaeon]|jgi:hypothetical protein|nr:hypothetical protein [Euryarchaeota archaeon]